MVFPLQRIRHFRTINELCLIHHGLGSLSVRFNVRHWWPVRDVHPKLLTGLKWGWIAYGIPRFFVPCPMPAKWALPFAFGQLVITGRLLHVHVRVAWVVLFPLIQRVLIRVSFVEIGQICFARRGIIAQQVLGTNTKDFFPVCAC